MLFSGRAVSLQLLPLLIHLTQHVSATIQTHPKRGLIYIYPPDPHDITLLTGSSTDLTWYYNYDIYPTTTVPSALPFTPMLHSLPTDSASTKSFVSQITTLLASGSYTPSNPLYLLTFNEPDQPSSVGGSSISPSDAAHFFHTTLLPLRNQHPDTLRLSLPATSSAPQGLTWLQEFNTSCRALSHHNNAASGCGTFDFLPTHYYGPSLTYLQSWLGQLHAYYPSLPIWLTEFAAPAVSLQETESFYNASTAMLDGLGYVERYAWFGTFRGDAANGYVGENVAFFDNEGGLTDLGSWYAGGTGTGRGPESAAGRMECFGLGSVVVLGAFLSVFSGVWFG